jgi:hypothetical protein
LRITVFPIPASPYIITNEFAGSDIISQSKAQLVISSLLQNNPVEFKAFKMEIFDRLSTDKSLGPINASNAMTSSALATTSKDL